MTLQQEQREDWEELSRLREENRELRRQVANLKRTVSRLQEQLTQKYGIPF